MENREKYILHNNSHIIHVEHITSYIGKSDSFVGFLKGENLGNSKKLGEIWENPSDIFACINQKHAMRHFLTSTCTIEKLLYIM